MKKKLFLMGLLFVLSAAVLLGMSGVSSEQNEERIKKDNSVNSDFKALVEKDVEKEMCSFVERLLEKGEIGHLSERHMVRYIIALSKLGSYGDLDGLERVLSGYTKTRNYFSGSFDVLDINDDGEKQILFLNVFIYKYKDQLQLYRTGEEWAGVMGKYKFKKPLLILSTYSTNEFKDSNVIGILLDNGVVKASAIVSGCGTCSMKDLNGDGTEELICIMPVVLSPPIARGVFSYPRILAPVSEGSIFEDVTNKHKDFFIGHYRSVIDGMNELYSSPESDLWRNKFMDELDDAIKKQSKWHMNLYETELKTIRKSLVN